MSGKIVNGLVEKHQVRGWIGEAPILILHATAALSPHATPPTTHLAVQSFGRNGEYNAINFAKVSNFRA